ncbi:MAG: ABC transporter substrate-binding protein [Prevotella sp.]|nr:ABC transporter substrate-binding protein [Prevotella sp.]
MKLIRNISLLLLLVTAFVGCHQKNVDITDFNKVVYAPKYATGFEIMGAESKESVIINVKNPWQGADSINTQLFIARNGEDVPDGFNGQVIHGTPKRIVTMSSTIIAMLDAVGAINTVVGVSGMDYILNPKILAKRDSIGDVGYEGNINYEMLLSLDPDLVLFFGIRGVNSMEGKLREFNIPYMYVGDHVENSPIGKAEWLVAISEIVGKRDEGIKVFSEIPERYDAWKKKVAAAKLAAPKVMMNIPYNGTWFMPSTESYVVQLVADAGGDYIYKKNTGTTSMPIDLEEAYQLVSASDVWLDVGLTNSLDEVKAACPKFTDTNCFIQGNVYNNNLRSNEVGGSDYFESGVVNPDLVLRDLIKIFHPELVQEDFVYYKQLK